LASLTTDIIGRVERMPLRPSSDNALMPLFEAVHNALHAVDDRFKEQAGQEGRIDVTVHREDFSVEESPVTGFTIEDNGIGLDDENYRSFLRPDSRHKVKRGGKGIGRLGWLKVFSIIEVDTTYQGEQALQHRSFNFRLTEEDQVHDCEQLRETCPKTTGTRVSLQDYKGSFINRCPPDPDSILQKLAAHFLTVVVADNPVAITVTDGSLHVRLDKFIDIRVNDIDPVTLKLEAEPEEQTFELRHLRIAKKFKPAKGFNRVLMFGHDRSVDGSIIDNTIGLTLLDNDEIYIGCISSPYLDRHVNSERTAFTLSDDEMTDIKRQLTPKMNEFLKIQVDKVLEAKRRVTELLIHIYPQFLFLRDEMEDFISKKLKAATRRPEDVFIEMARARYRRQTKVNKLEHDIKKKGKMKEQIDASVAAYRGMVNQDQKGVLAEYVMRRKAVLDVFSSVQEYDEQEKETHYREAIIHSLICPMGTDSTKIDFEDHNLWMIDDRLAFYAYFNSDRRLSKFVDSTSDDRPDLTFFYDTCFSWRGEGEQSNSVVIVEFKKPMRDDYSGNENPLRQVSEYVTKLKTSDKIMNARGRKAGAYLKTASYHCYIIADLTPTLVRELQHFSLRNTPDGEGRVGYVGNENAYVEIIPYDKLLREARLRQAIFFQKLGLTDFDPDVNASAEAVQELDAEMAEAGIEEEGD
jgi:hypothetical protein